MLTPSERSIEIAAPVSEAFAIVSDVSALPRILRGVDDARRLDDGTLEFRAGGRRWSATVTEMIPDVSVAWTSRGEYRHSGVIDLEPVAAGRTRVTLRIDQDADAGAGDPTADLHRLNELVRARPPAEGARRLLSLAAVLGARVTDTLGEPIGAVADVHVDLDDGAVTSIAVDAGAGRAHLVPIDPLPLDAAVGPIAVPFPPGMVGDAPGIEAGVEPTDDQLAAAREHFADPGRWERERAAARARQTTPAPTPELGTVVESPAPSWGVPAPTPEIAEAQMEGRGDPG